VRYPALPADNILNYTRGDFVSSAFDGINELRDVLRRENARCPDEKIILAGYSQGALVVHEALSVAEGASSQYRPSEPSRSSPTRRE